MFGYIYQPAPTVPVDSTSPKKPRQRDDSMAFLGLLFVLAYVLGIGVFLCTGDVNCIPGLATDDETKR
jgi:hypothetical protein